MPTIPIVMKAVQEFQRTAVEQWLSVFEDEQEWQQAAAKELVAPVEQQAYFQRYSLELTRTLVHRGITNTAATVPGGDAMAEPVHTAVNAQFDVTRSFQNASLEAIRTVSVPASEYTASVDEPVTIDVESGTESTSIEEAEATEEAEARAKNATVEYATLVGGTVAEVKERVKTKDVDIEHVIAAERAGDARVTLLEWLERQLEAQEDE